MTSLHQKDGSITPQDNAPLYGTVVPASRDLQVVPAVLVAQVAQGPGS